jgi:Zn-dependent protease
MVCIGLLASRGMDLLELARNFVGFFVILLFSLCFHEWAHGMAAKWLGDDTAERMGRLTLNPTAHMDMMGTVILPAITVVLNSMGAHLPYFGWAKPVPVNVRNLKNPRKDMFWIASAGPVSNLFLAAAATGVLAFAHRYLIVSSFYRGLTLLLGQFIVTNLFLAFFNLIPLNPLDGGRIISRFLPASWAYKLEQYESVTSMALMVVILMGGLKILAIPVFHTFQWLMRMAEHGF